jgi:hypothetical protein
MKADVVRLAAVILVAAPSAAHAASKTIIMNSIDAKGVGKEVDPEATPGLLNKKSGATCDMPTLPLLKNTERCEVDADAATDI